MSSKSVKYVIALVGRPNVGKSTLFNRLTGGRRALVAPMPGVTRDRREGFTMIGDTEVKIIDTGGLSFDRGTIFSAEIEEQVTVGVRQAGLVWLIVDGVEGLNPYDQSLYRWLLEQQVPVLLIANKVDNHARKALVGEFYSLGVSEVLPISATHGTGIEDALLASAKQLTISNIITSKNFKEEDVDEDGDGEDEDRPIRIALLGRPNVGKSSLMNNILGEDRMIVSDLAGTTREAIEVIFERKGITYQLVDTAGIRRKSKTKEHLDKVGALNSINALRHIDVAVLVLDSTQPVADQDAKIAGYILEQKRALVIAMNKWDQIGSKQEGRELEEEVRDELKFLPYAPLVKCSAATGFGMGNLFDMVQRAYKQYNRRVQTADLNRVVQLSVMRQPPPAQGYVPTKVFYGSQVRTRPPTFCLFTNHIKEIRDSYTRYMENQFRFHFGFEGTPLTIQWKGRKENAKKK